MVSGSKEIYFFLSFENASKSAYYIDYIKENPYKCEDCNKYFFQISSQRRHERVRTLENL